MPTAQTVTVGQATTQATPTGTMRAIAQRAYGAADVLEPGRLPIPEAADNEVLVRVHAAGLDRGTWHVMRGEPYPFRLVCGLRTPKNPAPGLDLAGTVVAIGSAVTRFSVGDEVFGIGRGSFAEYSAALEAKLAHKPAGASFEQAAVVAVSGLTALQALRDAARVKSGHKVLITGASGGVGSFAVQIAKAYGADVTAVCSTAKVDFVRSLGADRVIDYTRGDFLDAAPPYDVIIDIAGNATLTRLRRAMTPTGALVIVGGEGRGKWTGGMGRPLRASLLSPLVQQRLVMFMSKERGVDLEPLAELIDAGTLTPRIDSTYPLERASDAMLHLDSGQVRGKIAITI